MTCHVLSTLHFCHMRHYSSLPILLGALFLFSCGGPEPISLVGYPAKSFSGKNLLHESLISLDSTEAYTMTVQIDRGQTMKIVLTNLSETRPKNSADSLADFWTARIDLNTGWYVLDYDYEEHSQTFYSEGPETPHMNFDFSGCGKMSVDIYENANNNLTTSKTVSWESFCDN